MGRGGELLTPRLRAALCEARRIQRDQTQHATLTEMLGTTKDLLPHQDRMSRASSVGVGERDRSCTTGSDTGTVRSSVISRLERRSAFVAPSMPDRCHHLCTRAQRRPLHARHMARCAVVLRLTPAVCPAQP